MKELARPARQRATVRRTDHRISAHQKSERNPDHRICFLIEILVSSRRSYNSHNTETDTSPPEKKLAISITLKPLVRNA